MLQSQYKVLPSQERLTPSGSATITLLPDSDGAVGQVTVSNDAGSQTIH